MIKKRVFKTKVFSRLISKKIIPDQDILKAVNEMENGLYDADLGGNVYKKRIAVGNRGKNHGARTIVATRFSKHWYFIFGFKKNERNNINNVELANLINIAEFLLDLTSEQIDKLIHEKMLMEVMYDNHKK